MNLSRTDRILWALLGLGVVLYVWYELSRPVPPDWRPTFSPKDKIPYGLYALDNVLPQAFTKQSIHRTKRSAYEVLTELNAQKKQNTNFVWINVGVDITPPTMKALKQYVKRGNAALVSSYYWPSILSDSLKVKVGYGNEMPGAETINQYTRAASEVSDTSAVKLRHNRFSGKKFWFPSFMLQVPFSRFDSTQTNILGDYLFAMNTSEGASPNLIQLKIGKGRLLLHTHPYAFTNYGLLKGQNAAYAFGVLSQLPLRETYVDFYRRGSASDESLLQYVWRSEGLRWAMYGLFVLLGLYLFSGSKRRQRAIPVWEAPRNTTLDFVQTLGRLYYRKKDHKDLAERKIMYFMESVRHRYQVQTTDLSETLFEQLAAKSGHRKEEVASLFRFFDHLRKKTTLTNEDLRELTRRLYRF